MNSPYVEYDVIFEDAVLLENKIIFPGWNINGIFCMNLENYELILQKKIPRESFWITRGFGSICSNGDSLFLGPCEGECFGEYRISENKVISYKNPFYIDKEHNSFLIAFAYKQYVYFVGAQFPGIVKYDAQNNEWKKLDGWVAEIDKNAIEGYNYFTKGVCIIDGVAYLASSKSNYVLALNLENDQYNLHKVGELGVCYEEICYDGNSFWLAPLNAMQPITKWTPVGNTEFIQFPSDFWNERVTEEIVPWRIIYVDQYIWLIPIAPEGQMAYNRIIKVSVKTKEFKVIDIPVEDDLPKERIAAWLVLQVNGNILFGDMKTRNLYKINVYNEKVEKLKLRWNKKNYLHFKYIDYMEEDFDKDNKNLMYEADEDALPTLINEINRDRGTNDTSMINSMVGVNIHKKIIEKT